MNYSEVDILDILEESISFLKFKADEKNLDLEIKVNQNSLWPPKIYTDENRLKQIVINLVSNALKYTLYGHVYIYSKIDEKNMMLGIVVEDSGVGISIIQQEKLFKVFTKMKLYRELNKEGVGLGLAISKNMAIALGGDIKVESTPGVGSRFTLFIPLTAMELIEYNEVKKNFDKDRECDFNLQTEDHADYLANQHHFLTKSKKALNASKVSS